MNVENENSYISTFMASPNLKNVEFWNFLILTFPVFSVFNANLLGPYQAQRTPLGSDLGHLHGLYMPQDVPL